MQGRIAVRKSRLIVAAAIGLVLVAIAGAHVFTASPQLRIAKVPEGTTDVPVNQVIAVLAGEG